jgi:SAM-dependent methyltransferase
MESISPDTKAKRPSPPSLRRALESKALTKRSFPDYRGIIQRHYDGLPGKLTALTGYLTMHETLAGCLIGPKSFDVRGCKRILDAACGNGRYTKFLLREADDDAMITGFDFSQRMLHRARRRLQTDRATLLAADITRLPYADGAFDAILCGWVLEHLPDPRPGLKELARVLEPGGKLLLMATEDTWLGAVCSRLWYCRTYNRKDLRKVCAEYGLLWRRDLRFSKVHAALNLGGITEEFCRV